MSEQSGSVETFSATRGVLALGVMLGAARLPERFAAAGVALAARIAPAGGEADVAGAADLAAVRIPAQRRAEPSLSLTATP